MSATSFPLQKPYLLLEYFPNAAKWHSCHVNAVDSKKIAFSDRVSVLNPVPCKFCAEQAKKKPAISQVDAIFAKSVGRAQPPSPDLEIEIKGPLVSFNHVYQFVIKDGIIWSRRSNQNWTPIFFDGFPEGNYPCSLHADGANLVVLDNLGYVHYKKVLREHRREDLVRSQMVADDWKITAPYLAVDKAVNNNWKGAWFTLPVLSGLVNLFDGKKIKIPADALAWGISHRGTYNDYYKDDIGIAHPVNTGVTTLYVLLNNGKDIQKLDPWSPPKADMNLQVTDTTEITFKAFNMSTSASTLMLLGYEARAGLYGGTTKTLKIKTRLADIDTEGLNPGLEYTFLKERTKGEAIRVISSGTWQDHTLPDIPFLTGEISIFQTGEGNDARQMRLEAYGPDNLLGYYFKMISETSWTFKAYKIQPKELKEIKPFKIEDEDLFCSTVCNLVTTRYTIAGHVQKPDRIELSNFGEYSASSTLTFYYPDGEETLILRRKKTLLNFLRIKHKAHYLINYAEDIEHKKLGRLFHVFDNRIERVIVRERQSEVTIQGYHFSLIFKKPN